MTGKALKRIVNLIPDDATVFVAGMGESFWDWTYHSDAEVIKTHHEHYHLDGVDRRRPKAFPDNWKRIATTFDKGDV